MCPKGPRRGLEGGKRPGEWYGRPAEGTAGPWEGYIGGQEMGLVSGWTGNGLEDPSKGLEVVSGGPIKEVSGGGRPEENFKGQEIDQEDHTGKVSVSPIRGLMAQRIVWGGRGGDWGSMEGYLGPENGSEWPRNGLRAPGEGTGGSEFRLQVPVRR